MTGNRYFRRISPFLSKIVTVIDPWTQPKGLSPKDGLRYWQEQILLLFLLVGVVVGLIAYIPSVFLNIKEGTWLVAALDSAVYAIVIILFFCRLIPYRIRAGVVVSLAYLLGIALLWARGPLGSGSIWLFTFPLITAVLMGMRTSLISLVINALTLAILGCFIEGGFLDWNRATMVVYCQVTSPARSAPQNRSWVMSGRCRSTGNRCRVALRPVQRRRVHGSWRPFSRTRWVRRRKRKGGVHHPGWVSGAK